MGSSGFGELIIIIFFLRTSLNKARAIWTTKFPRPKFQKAANNWGDFIKRMFDLNIFDKPSSRCSKIPDFFEMTWKRVGREVSVIGTIWFILTLNARSVYRLTRLLRKKLRISAESSLIRQKKYLFRIKWCDLRLVSVNKHRFSILNLIRSNKQ